MVADLQFFDFTMVQSYSVRDSMLVMLDSGSVLLLSVSHAIAMVNNQILQCAVSPVWFGYCVCVFALHCVYNTCTYVSCF